MVDDIVKESSVWPVNELGEIILTPGIGSSAVAGFIPSSTVPSDPRTGAVRAVFSKAVTETVAAGTSQTYFVAEGNQITFTPTGATGTITKYKTDGSVDFTTAMPSASITYGNYTGTQKFVVTTSVGSVGVMTGSGVLGVQTNKQYGNMKAATANLLFGSTAATSGSVTKAWSAAISAWGDFHAVQVIFENSNATASLMDNHTVAASSTAYPGGTFNIRTPTGGWKSPAGAVTCPGGSVKSPGVVLGPKIEVASIPRAAGEGDGGTMPLLFLTFDTLIGNATAATHDLGANFPAGYDSRNEGFSILTTGPVFGAALAGSPGSWTSGARETLPGLVFGGVLFHYNKKKTTIAGVADSLMAGGNVTGIDRVPYMFKACARIQKAGKEVSYMNGSVSGANKDQILTNVTNLSSVIAPDIMVLNGIFLNSPYATQADWDAQWISLMAQTEVQLSRGGRVVIMTPYPNDSYTTGQNAFRLIQRQKIIASGLPYVDLESLCDAAGHFVDSSLRDATNHLTDAGNEAVAALVIPVLSGMVA